MFTAMIVPVASNTATCADKLSSVERSSASVSTPGTTSIGVARAFRCPRRFRRSDPDSLWSSFVAHCMSGPHAVSNATEVSLKGPSRKRPNAAYSDSDAVIGIFPIASRAAIHHLQDRRGLARRLRR